MGRSRFESQQQRAPRALRKKPLTVQSILAHKREAEDAWNAWASRNKEAREQYEIKFAKLAHLPPYEKKRALEELCLVEERNIFMAAARLWYQMYYWGEVAAAYQADKQIIDVQLNEDAYWWKLLEGRDNPIHHEYEPVKSQVFLPKVMSQHRTMGDAAASGPGSVAGFKVSDRRAGVE